VKALTNSTPFMLQQPNRIPSLDGLRAFLIVLLMFAHAAGTHNGYPAFPYMADLATFGVRIFFMISEFLITSLLLREQENYRRLSEAA
jgi:peptidoglycan/LPS O-acetylase OafA/YrhL